MSKEYKKQERQKRVLETGLPLFFEHLIEFCEELRFSNHLNVEQYGLNKVFYLLKVNDKIKTRNYLDNYQLYESLHNVINSSEKTFNKNSESLKKLKKGYWNGRRNS